MPKDRSCPFQRENPIYKEGSFPAIFNILLIVLKEKEHENWKPLHKPSTSPLSHVVPYRIEV